MEFAFYGNPVLRKVTSSVLDVNEDILKLIGQMYAVVYTTKGIGLAAPQIGVSSSVAVIDLSTKGKQQIPVTLINPKIVSVSDRKIVLEEGCLSFPGIFLKIERPEEIVVEYLDAFGKEERKTYAGFLARVIQHEVDHLNGKLFIDCLSLQQRLLIKGKLKKIIRLKYKYSFDESTEENTENIQKEG